MNILETIVKQKKVEVAQRKQQTPAAVLEQAEWFSKTPLSLRRFLLDESKTGIIAEFKRKSPSKGWINADADPAVVTTAYTQHGASGLSVLTDESFFGGSLDDLKKARISNIPVLRKDFIIDAYQVVEAKAVGADVILLIAANLTPAQVKTLASTAKNLGLEVLLEIHSKEELEHICDEVDIVGVNNRNLKTFEVSIETSVYLGNLIPADKIKISESGISDVKTIKELKEHDYKGFLIGENFMKAPDPAIAFAAFVEQLKS
ncbi:indole-3-glycerol phosphate synthase TrpC [Agriterribacter sp.]|uniref:indole-3-glycerol phosphate synthase TrpC n=1 Tax=Agriterribacter sp. TaxID=2821509 RepID=UPI002B9ABC92|nr:indole-3-glycerol phosphate synthase TrpC [Agriterribacter sp.]HRP57986.1 indole-3-glycerol phosphate synthase TrpC [Agriterribacter sp.]